jgi:hypothetical protein
MAPPNRDGDDRLEYPQQVNGFDLLPPSLIPCSGNDFPTAHKLFCDTLLLNMHDFNLDIVSDSNNQTRLKALVTNINFTSDLTTNSKEARVLHSKRSEASSPA